MRIAISADSKNGIESVISPHFGRCPHFVLVDVDEVGQVTQIEAIDNPFYGNHQPGQVPGFIHSQGANIMLTGGMGARAVQFFGQFDIEPVTGASGTVRIALDRYLSGALTGAAPCAVSQDHHGDVVVEGTYEQDAIGRLREELDVLQSDFVDTTGRLKKLLDKKD